MAFVSIPYEIKNGVAVGSTAYLLIDTNDYPLCQDMGFELPLLSVVSGSELGSNSYSYQGDTYTCTSLSATDLLTLIKTAFACPPTMTCGCVAQFTWTLTPMAYRKWVSTTIVKEIADVNVNCTYQIRDFKVAGVQYASSYVNIWTDADSDSLGHASVYSYQYCEAIVAWVEDQNIPTYKGAVIRAVDNEFNNSGVGILELYFTHGTTVVIDIYETRFAVHGTFTSGALTTCTTKLTLTDSSTIPTGSELTASEWIVYDGVSMIGSTVLSTTEIYPYNIFYISGDAVYTALDPNKGWIIKGNATYAPTCWVSATSTAVISIEELADCITNRVEKTGTSI